MGGHIAKTIMYDFRLGFVENFTWDFIALICFQ